MPSPSDLLSVGTNDVPRPGGGVYRSDDVGASRDFELGEDASDRIRREILTDLIHRLLADPSWLRRFDELVGRAGAEGSQLADRLETAVPGQTLRWLHMGVDYDKLIDSLIESDLIWGARFFEILEYSRTMHAEMDAITSAARKGTSIDGATLYCTTLPCHECAKLIIGAGIRRVIFIEPFEKSRTAELYSTEINFTTLAESRRGAESRESSEEHATSVGASAIWRYRPRRLEETTSPRRTRASQAIRPSVAWNEGSGT